jgi:hypothetical protein
MMRIIKGVLTASIVLANIIFWHASADASRSYTVSNISPLVAEFDSDVVTANTFTVRVQTTNTQTNNQSELIYQVVFTVSGTYTTFNAAQPGQANLWTCTRNSATQVTCSTDRNNGPNRILNTRNCTTCYQDFRLSVNSVASSFDQIDHFSGTTASYRVSRWTTGTSSYTYAGNPAQLPASWTWKTLGITLNVLPANPGNACTITLTMHVSKLSSAATITVTPSLSAPILTGGATVNLLSGPNPASVTLTNAAPTRDIVWTYRINGGAGSTVQFTGCASTGATCVTGSGATRTSRSVQSNIAAVTAGMTCNFSLSWAVTPACFYPGDTATFTMTVINTTGSPITTVRPSALTCSGTAQIGAPACSFATGPTPTTVWTLATSPTGSTFTWTAVITGNANDTFAVTGNATGQQAGLVTAPTATSDTARDLAGYSVSVNPSATNGESAEAEFVWTVTNYACANINQIIISIPGGWVFADDGYAMVSNMTGNQDDLWTRIPGTSTFTAQAAGDSIPNSGRSGDFSLLFSGTPAVVAATPYTFNVRVTDDAIPAVSKDISTTITVNPYGTGTLNDTSRTLWHEDVK